MQEIGALADELHVVSIMNYPADQKFLRMGQLFLDSVLAHGADKITLLYEDSAPQLTPQQQRSGKIVLRQGHSVDVGHPHFNLRFKLPNLTQLDEPFLFLDADTLVLSDLHELWQYRHDKPWIGINHQWVPSDPRTHRTPFLNSGVQLVGEPRFYHLAAILAAQNAVVPLSRHSEMAKLEMFPCPGNDQAVLFRYFQSIGYDYTHPQIGPEWNSCAGVTQVSWEQDHWQAQTVGLEKNHDVKLIHYWSQFKPWLIDCPIYYSSVVQPD